jgi:hypothetical protein
LISAALDELVDMGMGVGSDCVPGNDPLAIANVPSIGMADADQATRSLGRGAAEDFALDTKVQKLQVVVSWRPAKQSN